MPNIGGMFPSRYLKAGDLDGREIAVTIKNVVVENVGQTKEPKPVLYFKGAAKGLVLNVTNSKRISQIVGSEDTDDWPGHKITLYATETEFAGEQVDCIRVRLPKKAVPAVTTKPVKAGKTAKVKAATVVEPEPDDPFPTTTREPGDETEVERDIEPDDEEEVPFDHSRMRW